MDVLKTTLLLLLSALTLTAYASGEDHEIDPRDAILEAQSKQLCHSTDEYTKTLKFLRQNKTILFPENTSRLISEKVAKGCNGASERFAQVLVLLKSVGLSDRKSLEMALEFSTQPPEVQKNFTAIFTRAFLGEFFDYDYAIAAKLAYELSKDYHGDATQAREDFIELVRFCKDGKNLDLPTRLCAEFTVKLARLSQYHPKGVRDQFYRLFKDLRNKPDFAFDIKTALEVSYNVLRHGPTAPDNFFSGYAYATSKEGLSYDRHQALAFALRMADRSHLGEHPPLVPPLTAVAPDAPHAPMP